MANIARRNIVYRQHPARDPLLLLAFDTIVAQLVGASPFLSHLVPGSCILFLELIVDIVYERHLLLQKYTHFSMHIEGQKHHCELFSVLRVVRNLERLYCYSSFQNHDGCSVGNGEHQYQVSM